MIGHDETNWKEGPSYILYADFKKVKELIFRERRNTCPSNRLATEQ